MMADLRLSCSSGDGRTFPVIQPFANFSGIALIDADPYLGGDAQWYVNQVSLFGLVVSHNVLHIRVKNNFYRSLRNIVLDLRTLPVASGVNGIHWQVSQATLISRLRILMSQDASTNQVGMFMVRACLTI